MGVRVQHLAGQHSAIDVQQVLTSPAAAAPAAPLRLRVQVAPAQVPEFEEIKVDVDAVLGGDDTEVRRFWSLSETSEKSNKLLFLRCGETSWSACRAL